MPWLKALGWIANFIIYDLSLTKGERVLWILRELEGVIAGVQWELCQKPNGHNRAEIQKLLVHSRARRMGVRRQLIRVLERTALLQQRGLIYLDTQAGSSAEAFYRALGYRYLGKLPDYACTPDGDSINISRPSTTNISSL